MKRMKIKKMTAAELLKEGYRYVRYNEDNYCDCMKKIFPIRLNKKDTGLYGVIVIDIEDRTCRTDVLMVDGHPYTPYYVTDSAHKDIVDSIKKKIYYELHKVLAKEGRQRGH